MENLEKELIKLYNEISDRASEARSKYYNHKEKVDLLSSFFTATIVSMLSLMLSLPVLTTILSIGSFGVWLVKYFERFSCEWDADELEKLKDLMYKIRIGINNHFYEAYVLTDYFKDKNFNIDKVNQMNEYLACFDKDKYNSCFNEVGMKYNYSPISENKLLEIKDKENIFSVNNENGFEVITDTRLVDKYLEQPLFLEDNQKVYESSINNLELKPGVFDSNKKKLNKENNGYTHIEISICKVKVLTIDKRK